MSVHDETPAETIRRAVPVSEHDEPKTALTPIEALLSWGVGRDTGGVDRLIPAEDLRRALDEARVLLAEGYTTSPAPEATRRCGYAILDPDGIEEPCDRPATGWRWYQDVGEHEDMLDVACDHHENEGGRRMARLAAENARLRDTLAEGYTTTPAPEAVEPVEWEWSVTDTTSVELGIWPEERHTHPTRERAENEFVRDGDDVLLRRRAAGPWVPVDRGADGHEEGEQ